MSVRTCLEILYTNLAKISLEIVLFAKVYGNSKGFNIVFVFVFRFVVSFAQYFFSNLIKH